MKNAHDNSNMASGPATLCLRAVALAASLLVSGCASVQVDVDVYKGPFSHEQEIQIKQYTSLAIAAKPVLDDLYRRVKAHNRKPRPDQPPHSYADVGNHDTRSVSAPVATGDRRVITTAATAQSTTVKGPCEFADEIKFNERFLCNILDLYEDEPELQDGADQRPANYPSTQSFDKATVNVRAHQSLPLDKTKKGGKLGLLKLTEEVTQAYSTLHKSGRAPSGRALDEIDAKVNALNEALIYFAQTMLFTVNNQQLFDMSDDKMLTDEEREIFETQTAVLQSLGNTILVHANDLQRRKLHSQQHAQASAVQSQAIKDAFRLSPSAAFDALLKQLDPKNITRLHADRAGARPPAGAPPTAQRQELEQAKILVATKRSDSAAYRTEIANLVAAYRTVVGEQATLAGSTVAGPAELQSAILDRQAITALYPAEALREEDKTADGAFKPLADWLTRESAAGVAVSPQRLARLTQMNAYLTAERARLTGSLTSATRRADILKALVARIHAQSDMALRELNHHIGAIDELDTKIAALSPTVERLEGAHASATAHDARNAVLTTEVQRAIAVIASVRADVVKSGEQAGVTGVDGIRGLLILKLDAIGATTDQGKFGKEDIALARLVVSNLPPEPGAPCDANCSGMTSLKAIDNLIASLQAQRVRALAAGDPATAAHIVAAIDAAYSQRTSMIYLRPASDYLRSVYSSSAFQDGTDRQYRNMLTNWMRYYKFWEPKRQNVKEELEKLYWQNINKVTVGGGGSTNYVLAKDDVGNWYVKAYSADPEMIFKSATSLALFSAGKKIDLNLVRRNELQRKLDDTDSTLSGVQRKEVKDEIDKSNRQDGAPLLKVRDRYAARYVSDTAQQVSLLYETLTVMPDKIKAATTADAPAGCTPDYVDTALPALDKSLLESPRSKLAALMAGAEGGAAATAKTVTASEQAIQSGLTAIQLYAAKVHRLVSESKAAGCHPWQRTVANNARKYAMEQVLARATERKRGIERYEDALSSILDIAGEK